MAWSESGEDGSGTQSSGELAGVWFFGPVVRSHGTKEGSRNSQLEISEDEAILCRYHVAPRLKTNEQIQIRVHGDAGRPVIVYLPGMHGDWTLIPSFRARASKHFRFVEFTYPRTTTWSLEDYADGIQSVLAANGITEGWLLAESWGSQPAWLLTDRSGRRADAEEPRGFRVQGLVLAGGFVRHPWPWMVGMTQRRICGQSLGTLKRFLSFYPLYARIRLRHAPETMAELPEFLARRTEEDRQAAVHRLALMLSNDLRPLAAAATVPVYAVSGAMDPVVPWGPVFRSLRKQCPGFRESKVVWNADHNVLNSVQSAAECVFNWIWKERALCLVS